MTDPLAKEFALYEKHKQEFLSEGEGKYVVIKGDKIRKYFGSEEDALNDGYQNFGAKEPFLVKKVVAVEGVYYMFSPSPVHDAMCHSTN